MKIKLEELDLPVQEKIQRLDCLQDKTGFVFVENGSYITKKIDSIGLRTVYSTDDIKNMKSYKNSKSNYISATDKIMTLVSDANATKKLLHKAEFSQLFKTQYKFSKYFNVDNNLCAINTSGIMYLINTNDLSYETLDILNIIKNKYVFKQLYPSDILDIIWFDDNSYLISILNNGIYKFTMNGDCELFSSETNIDIMRILSNNTILCCRKNTYINAIIILDFSGRKIMTFNTLSTEQKYILDVIVLDTCFYIVADTMTMLHHNKILHKFELDDACISYHDISMRMPLNKRNSIYQYIKTIHYKNNLYTLYVVNNKITICYYNAEFNSYEYYDTDILIDIDELLDIDIVNNMVTIVTYDKIYQINNFKLHSINANQENIIDAKIICNNLYLSDGLILYKFNSFMYKNYSLLTLDVSDIKNVNNADIYITANKKLSYKFYDVDTKIEIVPSYGMYINNTDVIFKLYNVTSNLRIQINNLDENTEIYDVVLHINQLYLK